MKTGILPIALMLAAPTIAWSQPAAESHIAANVPDHEQFEALLSRDVTAYLTTTLKRNVSVELELLRDGPTQTGVAYPKFYLWVCATEDGKIVSQGAMRVAAIGNDRFEVTHYVTRGEIAAAPDRIAQIFPQPLLGKIRAKAGVK